MIFQLIISDMIKYIKMSLGTSLILHDVLNKMIKENVKDENNAVISITRDLPAKLLYKLVRNNTVLEKDAKAFNDRVSFLMRTMGTLENGQYKIEDSKTQKKYKEAVGELLETEVTHSVNLIELEDLEEISRELKLPVTEEEMKLLIGYLVNDDTFLEDLNTKVKFTSPKKKKH